MLGSLDIIAFHSTARTYKTSKEAMLRLWTLALFSVLPQLCKAVHLLSCTPTLRDNLMTYSINQDPPSDDNLSDCTFSWNNARNVLANNQGKLPLVTRNDLYTLETSKCFDNIDWEAHCTSKTTGFLTDFKANCTTSCIKDEFISGDKVGQGYSVPGLAMGLILAGLLVAVLFYMWYKSKKKDTSCTQCGCRYMNVKVPQTDPFDAGDELKVVCNS